MLARVYAGLTQPACSLGALQGRFVDMQIRWQNHTLRPGFCDNGGCDRRRVITAKTSHNGVDCKHHDRFLEGLESLQAAVGLMKLAGRGA